MLRKATWTLWMILCCCSPLFGQEWARKMFETTSHDFGTVARGAKAEFRFVLSNIYVEDVHISGVRSSCGCTNVTVEKPLLKTYETGAVVASLNTQAFKGSKGATITVTFDRPFPAEVQLHTHGYIRSDVVVHPGSIQLGSVDQGTSGETTVSVTYAGRSDWRIIDVRSVNPHLTAELQETRRDAGQVAYDLTVRLAADAPMGYLRDHLMLVTNDYQQGQVPVLVEGVVQSGIVVSPASLFMGVIEPGQRVTKQLVVRGKKPFRILSVTCGDSCFEFDTSGETEAKPVHVIPVTFVATDHPGKVLQTIRIETDLGDSVPELSAYAVVAK